MNDKQILESAPEKSNQAKMIAGAVHFEFEPFEPSRAIADIERIVALEAENEQLKGDVRDFAVCINELIEQGHTKLLVSLDRTSADKIIENFKLEQQAKALSDIKDTWIKKASEMPMQLECRSKGSSCYNWAMYYAKEVTDRIEQLRNQVRSDL